MEPSKVKERYQALKHQGPTRSLTRCNSTDLLPQIVPQLVFVSSNSDDRSMDFVQKFNQYS